MSLKKLFKKQEPVHSEFSDFFRKASSGERKRVLLNVARKAAEDQRRLMQKRA